METKTVKLIFPHQLFKHNPVFDYEGSCYLIEETLFFNQYRFHKQKIAYHRAGMRRYLEFLSDNGMKVKYIQADQKESDVRVLLVALKKLGVENVVAADPVDNWLNKRIAFVGTKLGIKITLLETPMFLNTNAGLSHFFKPGKSKFFQTEFYKQQRRKRNILLDEQGEPLGGKWTFDDENRKKYPANKPVVKTLFPPETTCWKEAGTYALKRYPNNPGMLSDGVVFPANFEESENWLQQFLEKRFKDFGEYEDAIVTKELVLHHSLLTPMLNTGLLTPDYVVQKAMEYAAKNPVPINSLEGFIRQIIGWREFIRGVYVSKGSEERTRNFWGFHKKIPLSFYRGTTGIYPVDQCIRKVLETGYCHHIERLMVLGNFMLLCEFDPDEVYRWFMEMFIDAYDWVMVPNVYGMSQFADGGMMSTKPYISGSNYLMKMSDYPKGEWQEIWDALFWRFLDKHRHFFLSNPRLGMLVKTYDKWTDVKKEGIQRKAELYLAELEKREEGVSQ